MIKYSELRTKYKIQVDKTSDDGLANLTHFIQNRKNGVSRFYRESAIDYATSIDSADFVEDSQLFTEYLPILWDVPFPAPETPLFKFIDLFAGIGGIRLAYQNLGGKSVFTSEIDNYSKKTYEANFGEVPFGDITKINENDIPDHDLLGVWATDRLGNPVKKCTPGGELQRLEAKKLAVNILMYGLTGTYKLDAMHRNNIINKLKYKTLLNGKE